MFPNKDPNQKSLCFLNPGEVFVSSQDCIIETVLGSCVSVALWDPIKKVGGMNHIVLSSSNLTDTTGNTRFAESAMIALANEMNKHQSKSVNWKTFIVGGSQQFSSATYTVGLDNVNAVKRWLEANKIHIHLIDVGGSHGRLVKFEPVVGRIKIINLRNRILR